MTKDAVCKFAKGCETYNNPEEAGSIPIHLFRNVFCNRGLRGWNNCQIYRRLNGEKTIHEPSGQSHN